MPRLAFIFNHLKRVKMAARNEITGDLLMSKRNSDAFREGWDRIFGKKRTVEPVTVALKMGQGSYEVQLPAEIVQQIGAGEGTALKVTVNDGAIILRP